jgi:hypothetical protein
VKCFFIKVAKCNKVVFKLPYKILIPYNCTYCQKATHEKAGSGNWLMNNYFGYYKSIPKLKSF